MWSSNTFVFRILPAYVRLYILQGTIFRRRTLARNESWCISFFREQSFSNESVVPWWIGGENRWEAWHRVRPNNTAIHSTWRCCSWSVLWNWFCRRCLCSSWTTFHRVLFFITSKWQHVKKLLCRFDKDEKVVGLANARLLAAYGNLKKEDFEMKVGDEKYVQDVDGLIYDFDAEEGAAVSEVDDL